MIRHFQPNSQPSRNSLQIYDPNKEKDDHRKTHMYTTGTQSLCHVSNTIYLHFETHKTGWQTPTQAC